MFPTPYPSAGIAPHAYRRRRMIVSDLLDKSVSRKFNP
ncbi:hypothetical protein C7S16_3441 [Burkholderia thailandensis]|uniref:Uncharacterized protein n=1 Tax=Burkholderia thailandensis TaxID=57975 RepID=A0AAW9CTE1_BURTH|nr:hypothetical protein [Burkholderia thailandensis]MDW9254245.1 hypothetical protein [Burkholderia thailandensis]